MRRCLSILLTLIAAALVPVFAGAEPERSGVTVKRDGDSVVLIPRDPRTTFLVFGCPRAGAQLACVPERVTWLVGEQRFPIKELAQLTILEVRKVAELELALEPSGLEMKERPAPPPVDPKPCRCDKPPPPPPPSAQDPAKSDPPKSDPP